MSLGIGVALPSGELVANPDRKKSKFDQFSQQNANFTHVNQSESDQFSED